MRNDYPPLGNKPKPPPCPPVHSEHRIACERDAILKLQMKVDNLEVEVRNLKMQLQMRGEIY